MNFLIIDSLKNDPSSIAIVIFVIVFGFLSFLVFGYLSYYQYSKDRWVSAKDKKNFKFFRKYIIYIFVFFTVFFLALAISFIQILLLK